MRDNYKSEEYYKKIYEQETFFVDSAENRLKKVIDLKGPDFHTIPNCYTGIANAYFLRFYLGYTMGKSYEELYSDVQKYVENGILGCNGESYWNLENIIYAVILFNKSEYHNQIKNLIDKYDDYKDVYIEELYSFLDHSYKVTTEINLWPKDNKPMLEVIELAENDKSAAVQRLKKYVDKEWFKTLKEGLITNTSKCYRGYWCIEAAALVKALSLDDTELKECKYYPYDMVHFCD